MGLQQCFPSFGDELQAGHLHTQTSVDWSERDTTSPQNKPPTVRHGKRLLPAAHHTAKNHGNKKR